MDLYQSLPELLPYIIVVAGGVVLYLALLSVTFVNLLFAERIAREVEDEREIKMMLERAVPVIPPTKK